MPSGNFERGTGFVFNHPIKGGGDADFLVTCKHVVENSEYCEFFFSTQKPAPGWTARQLDLGQAVDFRVGKYEENWFPNPDSNVDVAIMPLIPILLELEKTGTDCYINTLQSSMCPTADTIRRLDVREEFAFIGYPYGFYDERHLLPLIRSGWTASPVDLNFEGFPGFAVEAHFHPGSSGSPLVSLGYELSEDENGYVKKLSKQFLIGMAANMLQSPAGEEIGLGKAIRWEFITETVVLYLQSKGLW